MDRAVLLFWLSVLPLPEASGAVFSCGADVPTLRSIALGMSLRDIQRKPGPGKLIARAPNPGLNDETYLRWQIQGASCLITFDPGLKAIRISYSSRLRLRPFANVTLSVDTLKSIQERFGPSSERYGPAAGEGEYAFYYLVYYCGPGSSYEVHFRTERSCENMDMAICLEEAPFLSLPVQQVTIRRGRSSGKQLEVKSERDEPSARSLGYALASLDRRRFFGGDRGGQAGPRRAYRRTNIGCVQAVRPLESVILART
jgi:hypothetical protein